MVVQIDNEKCEGIGDCVDACPVEVIALEGDKCVVVNPDDCTDCEACVDACPREAITIV
ncbi:hypothetical protein HKBW3S42_00892 [Candidatus Hakubella thermalkaliphila]|uniref:4Fe-4S ferredoxin-type domain-containing protein n=1 Tax=Candidatus Hakubella thermalkaliphila TaxID=2754717 RepID=A0A6V8PJZ4_9ACTN|nr:4Fe-4S binding protein [Candidatus Hakubella thermalkaliphila]GFP19942.1 hypothetical protein HKBW3S03_01446 [Candidatus Hakubella thermalkaliphila]GFP21454.1 hypothetical protein HKBW3S06_00681 [Candidatus Hakubella thermalkaliphila]GFP30778.1 hypothetical protein HKBW3S34_01697 [Candidatus Hakubella thermalkaliphila]GFP32588.1 hypothetical protein HKBW3S42_00892 [Candidatus Hakubella thermalkaliphila]GFP35376.1 hypothetical protein HKBW3S43_01168 [Candidatus Hakubella thermalkaliphila]